MGFLTCSVLFFFFIRSISCYDTANCSLSLVPKGDVEASCYCDSTDRGNGWSYTCIDLTVDHFSIVKTLFTVEYINDHSVKFQCGEIIIQYEQVLNQIDLDKIQTFVFSSCPLPNVSYSEIIPNRKDYPIEQIKIEAKRDKAIFTPQVFGNLSTTLKSLILNDNQIETLPENLFANFTELQYLSLADNRLTTLPEGIFHRLEKLVYLEITNNRLESLPEDIFTTLVNLKKLYLYKNKIKSLQPSIFRNLKSLNVLDLTQNNLMLLPDEVFDGLSNLINLKLRANLLVTISESLFSNATQLMDIDMGLNKFLDPFPTGLFNGLTKLENVTISDCNMSKLPDYFFSQCPSLSNVNMERNILTTLPEHFFHNNSALKTLNLNFNSLQTISSDMLPNQPKLEKFWLYKNNLSVIPGGLFKHSPRIKSLYLGGNRLTNVNQTIFRDLPNLEILDLSYNNLTYFRLDSKNELIKSIDLSYNDLEELPRLLWTRHLRLEKLNLKHNKIENLTIPILYPSTRKTPVLDFSFNNIKIINTDDVSVNDLAIQHLPANDKEHYISTTLILYSNPFVCDCHMFSFYQYVKRIGELDKATVRIDKAQNLICKQPERVAGKAITALSPSQFTCELQDQCSYPCQCYTRPKDSQNIVKCQNQSMEELPSSIPPNTNVLYFEGNKLSSMRGFQDHQWDNLTEIRLDNNQLTHLDDWTIPVHLKNISLAGNYLQNLPVFVMDYISSCQDFQITLSDNPWMCNCSTTTFRKWLSEHYQFIPDVKEIMCANILELNHTAIFTSSDDILCPTNDWPNKLLLITVSTMSIFLALLLFIISVLYYRNKQTIIAYVYIHMHNVFVCFFNEEDMDEDKIFDAFVSYSASDRDVALKLVEELEEGDQRFRLCIHERNWVAGNQISWNIFNSVQNSRRTILVISKQFLESMWFQVEFHTAYYQMLEDKIDRLIIIVKGELPLKETLDKDLQLLLSTKTYLIWEEKWFWEKLKYAMPHKKHELLPSDVLALKDRPASDKIKPIDNQIAILSGNNMNKSTEKIVEDQNHTNSTAKKNKK